MASECENSGIRDKYIRQSVPHGHERAEMATVTIFQNIGFWVCNYAGGHEERSARIAHPVDFWTDQSRTSAEFE